MFSTPDANIVSLDSLLYIWTVSKTKIFFSDNSANMIRSLENSIKKLKFTALKYKNSSSSGETINDADFLFQIPLIKISSLPLQSTYSLFMPHIFFW